MYRKTRTALDLVLIFLATLFSLHVLVLLVFNALMNEWMEFTTGSAFGFLVAFFFVVGIRVWKRRRAATGNAMLVLNTTEEVTIPRGVRLATVEVRSTDD